MKTNITVLLTAAMVAFSLWTHAEEMSLRDYLNQEFTDHNEDLNSILDVTVYNLNDDDLCVECGTGEVFGIPNPSQQAPEYLSVETLTGVETPYDLLSQKEMIDFFSKNKLWYVEGGEFGVMYPMGNSGAWAIILSTGIAEYYMSPSHPGLLGVTSTDHVTGSMTIGIVDASEDRRYCRDSYRRLLRSIVADLASKCSDGSEYDDACSFGLFPVPNDTSDKWSKIQIINWSVKPDDDHTRVKYLATFAEAELPSATIIALHLYPDGDTSMGEWGLDWKIHDDGNPEVAREVWRKIQEADF